MRITIVSWGSDGDVRPYIALALGLKRARHEVRLATLAQYQEFVSSFGVDCVPMQWEFSDLELEGILQFRPFDTISFASNVLKNGLLSELWRVCQGSEAIIFNVYSYPSFYVAEKLGIPCYAACVQPLHQTDAFPHPYMTHEKLLGSIYNWLSYPFFDQVFWQFIRGSINQWRQDILNLSPLPIWEGVVRRMQQQKVPFLYSYSSFFVPKPSTWADDCIHVTGYWFLDTSDNWQPPTELMNFLSAGAPPVYISKLWGKLWSNGKLGREILIKVLELTGQRIILQGLDDGDLCDTDLNDNLFYIKGLIPHEWLFPKMAAVVHHGGLGTTMNCLRAGIPIITIPIQGDNDQLFWAFQVSESGLGISLIPQKEQLLVESLANAIRVAISDKSMGNRLAEMSKQIQSEDGVTCAVEAFHRHLPSKYQLEKFQKEA